MKFQNYFYLVAMLFLTFSCHRENDLTDDLSKNIKVELNQKSNVLKFGSKADLKEFINNYDKNSNRILDFYKEGFIPYRTTDNVDEATFIELTQKKKTIQSKSRLFSKSNHLNSQSYAKLYFSESYQTGVWERTNCTIIGTGAKR